MAQAFGAYAIVLWCYTFMQNKSVSRSRAGPSMLVNYVAVRCLDDDVNFFVSAR